MDPIGRVKSIFNLRGSVVLLSPEYGNVTKGGGYLSRMVSGIATSLNNRFGMDIRVVVPSSPNLDKSGFTKIGENLLFKNVDSVPVYAITKEDGQNIFSALYPNYGDFISDTTEFGRAFWTLTQNQAFGPVALVHGFEDTMGPAIALRPGKMRKETRTVFTPIQPETYSQYFDRETIVKQSDGHISPPAGFDVYSGAMFGSSAADTHTVWSIEYLRDLGYGTYTVPAHRIDLGNFLEDMRQKRQAPFVLGSSWHPSMHEHRELPDAYVSRIAQGYLRTIHGFDNQFSLNLREAVQETDDNTIPNMPGYLCITEWPDMALRRDVIQADLRSSPIKKVDGPTVVSRGDAVGDARFRDNLGAYVQIFDDIFARPDYNQATTYIGIASGGEATRLQGLSGTVGAGKGPIIVGINKDGKPKTFDHVALSQGIEVAAQLPNMGRGWIVLGGNDNGFAAKPLTYGDNEYEKLLCEAPQEIVLLTQPERVIGASDEKVDPLKDLGVMVLDHRTGVLRKFKEKPETRDHKFDRALVERMLSEFDGGASVHKNTFFMAMTHRMARIFSTLYSKKAVGENRLLHEKYQIDWSAVFVTASTTKFDSDDPNDLGWKQVWEQNKVKLRGKQIRDYVTWADWEYFWHVAQILSNPIKESVELFVSKYGSEFNRELVAQIVQTLSAVEHKGKAGILGTHLIGTWADFGSLPVYKDELSKALKQPYGNEVAEPDRLIARRMIGIPNDSQVQNSYHANVQFNDPNSVFIGSSVFEKGGRVGKGCLILFSHFKDPVDIPDGSICILNKISAPVTTGTRKDSSITFSVISRHPLEINGSRVTADITLIGGEKRRGTSLLIDPKTTSDPVIKDDIIGHYDLNGSIHTQPIHGITVGIGELRQMENFVHDGVNRVWFRERVNEILAKHPGKLDIPLSIGDLVYLTSLVRFLERKNEILRGIQEFLDRKKRK